LRAREPGTGREQDHHGKKTEYSSHDGRRGYLISEIQACLTVELFFVGIVLFAVLLAMVLSDETFMVKTKSPEVTRTVWTPP